HGQSALQLPGPRRTRRLVKLRQIQRGLLALRTVVCQKHSPALSRQGGRVIMSHAIRAHASIILISSGLALLSACGSAISASSKSISSPFASSSKSSSPEAAYREDVSDYTAAHLQSAGTPD